MGKTWKKRDGHCKKANNKNTKSYNEFYDCDDYSKNNSKNNHRSMKKAKDARREFEDNFSDLNIEF
jgi:hypothetical protein